MKRNNEKIRDKKRDLLFDTDAVSPVIATLILIVIAVIAAVAVGYLITGAQTNAGTQVTQGTETVQRTIKLAGASLLAEVSYGVVDALAEKDPGLTINVGAGTGNSGRSQVYNKVIDIAASGEIWPDTGATTLTSPDKKTGLEYKGREVAVIQGGYPDAWIFEQKIGTGLIPVVVNIPSKTGYKLKISKTVAATTGYNDITKVITINYTDLKTAWTGTNGYISVPDGGGSGQPINLTLVQRRDPDSTHQKIFSKWLTGDATKLDLGVDTNGAQAFNSIPDIIKYVRATSNTLSFFPWNPSATYASGLIAAELSDNGLDTAWNAPSDANKGLAGKYNKASKFYSGTGLSTDQGLASDAYYYTDGVPKGDVKIFIDFVLSADGQKILKDNGWFSP